MTRVVRLALVFYLPMLAGAFFLRAPGVLQVADGWRLGYALAAAATASVLLVLASGRAGRDTAWGRTLRDEFRSALGTLTSGEILWLSLLSAFGEEILFRGVLQPRVGLLWASLLFAAVHFPFRRALWPWTVFAGLMGLLLGGLTEWAGSLWPAILLHLCVNYFNLHDLAQAEPAPPPRWR